MNKTEAWRKLRRVAQALGLPNTATPAEVRAEFEARLPGMILEEKIEAELTKRFAPRKSKWSGVKAFTPDKALQKIADALPSYYRVLKLKKARRVVLADGRVFEGGKLESVDIFPDGSIQVSWGDTACIHDDIIRIDFE